jgi:hypothetical protein
MVTQLSLGAARSGERRRRYLPLLWVAGLFVLSACSLVQRPAPYDATIETTVKEFNEAILAHLEKMQGLAGLPEGEYGENAEFYATWRVKLDALASYAASTDVSQTCGPDDVSDKFMKSAANEINTLIQTASATIGAVEKDSLDPAKKYIASKLEAAETALTDLRETFHATPYDNPGFDRIKARFEAYQATYRRWHKAANRVAATINLLGTGLPGSTPPTGGCMTRLVQHLSDRFGMVERVHMKQKNIGFKRIKATRNIITGSIQLILKIQERKKVLTDQGLL